jgi:hypothetical protein
MIDTFLVPRDTTVTAKGDGSAVDVSPAANRVFLLTLQITKIVEQAPWTGRAGVPSHWPPFRRSFTGAIIHC